MRSAVGSVTCVPHTHGLRGRWALGAAGACPGPGRGQRRADNPASSVCPAAGLGLMGPAGLLPSPVWGPSRVRVGTVPGGEGGGRGPGMAVFPSACWPAAARPCIRSSIPAPLLCRGCFPLPVFFPALAPSRAAWSGGGGGAPPGGRLVLPLPAPLPSDPYSPFRKVWVDNVRWWWWWGERPGVGAPLPPCPTSVGTRCAFWDPAIPALPVCCASFAVSCSFLNLSVSAAALSLGPRAARAAPPGFLRAGPVFPCLKHVDPYTTHLHMLLWPVPGSWLQGLGNRAPLRHPDVTPPSSHPPPQSWEQALVYAVSDEESWSWGGPGSRERSLLGVAASVWALGGLCSRKGAYKGAWDSSQNAA